MPLPDILSIDGLASDEIVQKWQDAFLRPPCANDFGSFVVAPDPMGVGDLLMPPFSTKNERTAMLYIDRHHAPSEGTPIGYTWYPDRVRRRCEMAGLTIESVARAPVRQYGILIELALSNPGAEIRSVQVAVKVAGRMLHTRDGWTSFAPALENLDNPPETWRYDGGLGAMSFSSNPNAFSVHGSNPKPDAVENKSLLYNVKLASGETWRLRFAVALGEAEGEAAASFRKLLGSFDEECLRVQASWKEKIEAAFTPGNSVYSGHLPALYTDDKDLERLYYLGFAGGGLCCRRDNPLSQLGPTYVTLMPNGWTTASFLWDAMLSDGCWAMLDPKVLRGMMEAWLSIDLTKHLAVDYVTGTGIGYWYVINHCAIVRLAHTYIRYSGDLAWLDKEVSGVPVIEHIEKHARYWRELDRHGHGLADCGDGWSVGDGISTWYHEVAAFNACWVRAERQVAELRRVRGETARAQRLEREAQDLLTNVLGLYADGKGYWKCRHPEGRETEICLLYDFLAALESIPDGLTASMKNEMLSVFENHFKTPNWVRGLAVWDDDSPRSARPDWGWTGGYGAFPAMAVSALCRVGHTKGLRTWLRNIAQATWQGPLGQAHCVDDVSTPFRGGAWKSNAGDWTCVATGAYVSMLVESLFGARASVDRGLEWESGSSGLLETGSRLENVPYQGKNYRVTREGVEEM